MNLRPSDFGFESIPELRQFIEGTHNETVGEFLERIASHLESGSFAGDRQRASCAMLCFLSNVIGSRNRPKVAKHYQPVFSIPAR